MVIIRITLAVLWNRNFFSGSGSYFWKVTVPVLLHIYTIKSLFFLKN
jgi:hypothetical protein